MRADNTRAESNKLRSLISVAFFDIFLAVHLYLIEACVTM